MATCADIPVVCDNNEAAVMYHGGAFPISRIVYHITGDNGDTTRETLQTLFSDAKGDMNIDLEPFSYGRHSSRLLAQLTHREHSLHC